MKSVELLAPAGNKKSLIGAINAGADAVYVSDKVFGSKAYGQNFDIDDIIEAINYAHLRGVLVYVDVNTLIFNEQIDQLLKHTDQFVKANVDGFILQDYGMMNLLIKRYPNTKIHASSMVNTHHIQQAKFLKAIGIKRITMARETPLNIIKQIKKEVDIEIEVYVHGALCISYSGHCQMSLNKGLGSAGLGMCAGPCRGLYRLLEDNKAISKPMHLLSSKDLMTIDYIGDLIKAGVDVFKIEGSMQRPEYVVQTVLSYKNALKKHLRNLPFDINEEINDLKKVHNKQYTKSYMFNERPEDIVNTSTSEHLGISIGHVVKQVNKEVFIRLTDTLSLADGISFPMDASTNHREMVSSMTINDIHVSSAYEGSTVKVEVSQNIPTGTEVFKNKDYQLEQSLGNYFKENFKKVPLWGTIKIEADDYIAYTIHDDNHAFTIYSDEMIDVAPNKPTTDDQIRNKLSSFGNLPYYFDTLDIINDHQSFVSAKLLSEMHDKAIESITEARLTQPEIIIKPYTYLEIKDIEEKPKGLVAHVKTYDQLKACYGLGIKHIYYELPMHIDTHLYQKAQLIPVLPRILEDKFEYPDTYMTHTLTEHNFHAKELYAGSFIHVTNIHTANLLIDLNFKSITLSSELSYRQTISFYEAYRKYYKKHINLEINIYGRNELMITKHDVVAALHKTNPNYNLYRNRKYALKDASNHVFPLIDDGYRHVKLLNHEPLCLIKYINDLKDAHVHTYRLDFYNETFNQTLYIIRLFKKTIKDEQVPEAFNLRHTIGQFKDEAR
jgi:U32 family peptidase